MYTKILIFALNNIRKNDGTQYLNRYIAAGFISRLMLFEGTWQKYHKSDTELAKIPDASERGR